MALRYDLHTHSTASDGTLAPSQLVAHAARAGIDVLALTDHDTLDGVAEAVQEAKRHSVSLVPGVEISVTWGGRVIHVLGLGVDPCNEPLQEGLQRLRRFRSWRAQEIGRRLEEAGIRGAYEGASNLSGGSLIARTHFARYLVEAGVVTDLRKVFKRYLVRGKPGYVSGNWAELAEAVAWIRGAGGQAVVAHPARYSLTRSRLRRLLEEFVAVGGEGLEVISGSHSRDDLFAMSRHALDFGLLSSAGSDYHGPEHPRVDLGRLPELPPGSTAIWQGWSL